MGRLGIVDGLGRGAPGTPGARPMPEPELYGLLPGRGPPGRAEVPLVPKGLFPGRGAGFAPAAGAAGVLAGGVSGGVAAGGVAAGAAGGVAAGVSGGVAAGGAAGAGASPADGASAAASVADDGPDSSAAAVVFLVVFFAAFLVVFLAAAPSGAAGIASIKRRATGGSMVDEAERTNSPISCNFARTSLLSTPSSRASS